MDIDELIDHVAGLEGVLTLRPQPGDGSPEISWGDTFFYYAPDGRLPNGQPFATVVTKAYPDEVAPWLDRPEVFRLNIDAGDDAEGATTGQNSGSHSAIAGGAPDILVPHPVYGHLGWVCVTNPGERTKKEALALIHSAHARARVRWQRRAAREQS